MNKTLIRITLSNNIGLGSMVISSTSIAEKIRARTDKRQGDIIVEIVFPFQYNAFNWVAVQPEYGVRHIAHELKSQYQKVDYSYSSENPNVIQFSLRR